MTPTRRALLVALALGLAVPGALVRAAAPGATTASAPLAAPALGAALRRGGYVLYFRHTSTDFGQNDDAMTTFEDCAAQRNLTDRGRDEARAIGAAIARDRIPVGDVLASPYCRTRETAKLMFARATVEPAVRGGPVEADTQRYAGLIALLSAPVAPGTNRVIVSHGNPFHAVAGSSSYLAEGEAAVIAPRGDGRFEVVGRVPRDRWDELAGP